jgi:hypothetical protein
MLGFGGVTSVKSHDQRQVQGAGERQGECAAATKMRMDEPRAQTCQIWSGRYAPELLEQDPVERANGAAPPEQDRLDPQLG